jgi:hypothetical protein
MLVSVRPPHQGILSLFDRAGRSRLRIHFRHQTFPTKAPGCALVGNGQRVREIGAPAGAPWFAGHGGVAL